MFRSRGGIGVMRFLFTIKEAKILVPTAYLYLRLEFAGCLMQRDTTLETNLALAVRLVLRSCRYTKVGNAVVSSLAVDVINFMWRPFASMEKPSQPVRTKRSSKNPYPHVPVRYRAISNLTVAIKKTCLWIVPKDTQYLFLWSGTDLGHETPSGCPKTSGRSS